MHSKSNSSAMTKEQLGKGALAAGELITLAIADRKLDLIAYTDKISQKIDDKLEESTLRLENHLNELHAQSASMPVASESQVRASDAQAFFDAVISGVPAPPETDRELRARGAEGILARQVLYARCAGELPEHASYPPIDASNAFLADKFRAAIKEGKLEEKAGFKIGIHSVRLSGLNILVEYESTETVKFMLSAEGSDGLEQHLGYFVSSVGREDKIVIRMVPITFEPKNPSALREVEASNDLPEDSIQRASYIKPEELRSIGQRYANVMVSMKSPGTANKIILDGTVPKPLPQKGSWAFGC
ncbi:unnamed protein product [Peniophora sp. CBMAI 1063]|nr:unnamed protein product [Peniophora sp. CBMAI 1063]